jgi:hypothetical protein
MGERLVIRCVPQSVGLGVWNVEGGEEAGSGKETEVNTSVITETSCASSLLLTSSFISETSNALVEFDPDNREEESGTVGTESSNWDL